MIHQAIRDGINKQGLSCVLTEYESQKNYPLKGLIQSIGMKNREHSRMDYSRHGKYDEAQLLFIFNAPDETIDYENAVICTENHDRYYIRNCKPFYYKHNILYHIATITPCPKEVLL